MITEEKAKQIITLAEGITRAEWSRINRIVENVLPKMTEVEREKLLSFGQGMTFMKDEQAKKTAAG